MILDNLEEIYQEVLEELSYRVGIVNLRNKKHIDILSEILDTTKLAEYKSDILSELYKNVIVELDFQNKSAFTDYKSQHKMRPSTKVTIGDKETTVGAASSTTKQTEPIKAEKPKKQPKVEPTEPTKIVDVEELKKQFSKKSEATEGLLAKEYKTLSNGTQVRQMVDENGDILDVATTEGRKKAIELLDNRIKSLADKTNIAVKNFNANINVVQKWLGEIGEVTALKGYLESGVEAYLLTDSEQKNDIAFVKENGEKTELNISYISVKTTKGDGVVNKRGANCKADFGKLIQSGDVEYKIDGLTLKPTNVLGSIIDVKSGLFKHFTCNQENTEKVIVNGKQEKLTRYDETKHPNVNPKDIVKDSKGNQYFKSQSTFLKNRMISEKDIDGFFNDSKNDKYFTNLNNPSAGNPNTITDPDELKNTKEYIKRKLIEKSKSGDSFSVYDLHNVMHEIVGGVMEDSHVEIGATGDTLAVHYKEENPEPNVGVITKKEANIPVQKKYKEVSQEQSAKERRMRLSKEVLGLSSRTRALPLGKTGNYCYDGIDNMQPIGNGIPKEISIGEHIKQ